MMDKGILGKDYVVLRGRGGRDTQNGATCKNDEYMHLSVNCGESTICGKGVESFLLTYSDLDINCPKCVKRLVKGGSDAK